RFFFDNLVAGLLGYFVISTLRGFTLIPSTPIVLAGVLVFPPVPLFLVNQAAVYTSSAIVYFMARQFRFDHYFHEHYPDQVKRLTALLQRRELVVISAWGFMPVVPSDMIVYVCSVLRIRLWKTLLGVSIGEGIICALYIFGGAMGLEVLLGGVFS
ncbi:MAG: VTT domain-containing protein, partial [Natronospirillum sp.]